MQVHKSNQATTARLMTFNIQGSTHPETGANSWQHRAAINVKTIRRYGPDLIGFQEVQSANWETYREQLDDYGYVAGNRYGDEERTSIFWKLSRFALIESGEFWLSRTPNQPSCDWDAHQSIGVTWVKLRCLINGSYLLHLNTHLDHRSALSRLQGSKLIVERVAQLQANGDPAIVTGDFNCNPESPPYNIFKQNGFVDTYLAAGNKDGEVSTYHGFEGSCYSAARWGTEPFWRVDWILTRDGAQKVRTLCCIVARDAEPPVYPSDHYPVVAEVILVG
jgi:endonuclease/exonuclease/phosphatase family metal-dependent hydrolase